MTKKLYSALLTSFNADGTVNEKGTREIVRHNIDVNHADGLYVGGSTGENFMLQTATKKRIFEIVKDESGDDVDLIAQVGSIDLQEAKELANYVVNDLGYKTISAVTPFYYNFSFPEIKYYYDEIVKDVDANLIVYSIPALTGVSLSLDNFAKLFENPKIIGVKYTNADFFLLERLRNRFPDKKILFGTDEMLLPALSLGVDGAIGSTYNVNAARAKAEIEAFEAGNMQKALDIQHETNDLISAILGNGLYQTIKLLLQDMGVEAGYTKEPMHKPTPEMKTTASEIYAKFLKN